MLGNTDYSDIMFNEFDYNSLMNSLSSFKRPRDKVTQLLRKGIIIRVKKGLYVFGPQAKRGLYSREVLANLIYGPSYISLEYALAFYGLIPEKVNLLTCITGKRNKYFKTPVGEFQYTYLHPSLYPWGVTWIMLDEKHHMLMATKEKAIIDKVYFTNGLTTIRDVKDFLIENLRIERDELKRLDSNTLDSIAVKYSKKAVRILPEIIRKL